MQIHLSEDFQIFLGGRGPADLKILTNENFHLPKSSGIHNCQIWIYRNFKETENLFPKSIYLLECGFYSVNHKPLNQES